MKRGATALVTSREEDEVSTRAPSALKAMSSPGSFGAFSAKIGRGNLLDGSGSHVFLLLSEYEPRRI